MSGKKRLYTYDQIVDKFCNVAYEYADLKIRFSDLKIAHMELAKAIQSSDMEEIASCSNRIHDLLNRKI